MFQQTILTLDQGSATIICRARQKMLTHLLTMAAQVLLKKNIGSNIQTIHAAYAHINY